MTSPAAAGLFLVAVRISPPGRASANSPITRRVDARAMRILVSGPHPGRRERYRSRMRARISNEILASMAAAVADVALRRGPRGRRKRRGDAPRGQRRAAAGATWYQVVSGTRVEESDILDVAERSQAQIEFAAGVIVNLVGPAPVYLAPAKAKVGRLRSSCRRAGSRLSPSPRGCSYARRRSALWSADAIIVMRVTKTAVDFFVEPGKGGWSRSRRAARTARRAN